MNKTIEVNIPSLQELYNSLPVECQNKRVEFDSDSNDTMPLYAALQMHYNRLIGMMINECKEAIKPVIYMSVFDNGDNQLICNWSASDNNRPNENSYNFHGQNTSRWLYAGCLLYDVRDNTFSINT